MKRFYLAVALVALTFSSVANAGVIGSATQIAAPPFLAPDAALVGFSAFQISVASDDPNDVITAVDVRIQGQLHQRWQDTDFDFVADPTPVGPPANGRGDSHLTPLAGALVGSAPSEDNSGAGSPLPSGVFTYGLGTFLSGAWGIPGPSQTGSANLAYIVIPEGSQFDVQFNVQVATNLGGTFSLGGSDFFIPEPTSMSLAGFALASVVLMRRRS